MSTRSKRKILFIGEAGTVSHVARPAVLAAGLDSGKYEAYLACDRRFEALFDNEPFEFISINSVFARESVVETLASGMPLFSPDILDRYVEEDLRLLRDISPDLVVGDMRQSLGISSKITGTTYVNIINAQWSPYASLDLEMP
ncbi:MAG TPA: glycosyl transferase family 1, partial [Blastocatellia bacterium]|nr:glycosyl transferase family 1 [Blastocatellia bacterium]